MDEGKKEGMDGNVVDQNSGKITLSDNPSLQISLVKLDGINYLSWS